MPEPVRRVLLSDPSDTIYYEVAHANGGRISGWAIPEPADMNGANGWVNLILTVFGSTTDTLLPSMADANIQLPPFFNLSERLNEY